MNIPIHFSEKEVNFFSDSEENLWISVRDHGLIYVDKKTQKSERLLYHKNDATGISSNTVTNIIEDDFGNIWISSFDAGLNLLDKRRKEFIQSMRQWVIKQQEQEGRNNEKESFFFNSFHTLKKQMISLGVYSD